MAAQGIRDSFLLEPGMTFLNHGSFGARPREVLEAQDAVRREAEASPVEFLSRRSSALLDAALARLADYLHADASKLAFVTNATTAVAVAAASVGLGPGDEVLSTDHEYGACVMGWKRACAKAGAAWREAAIPLPWAGDGDFLARLEAAITPRTRVLFLSHITSATALRFPVEGAVALAAAKGIVTVIDGAHAPGHIDLDLEALGADFYAGNCHKWLCAPLGSAFLHVQPAFHARVEPLVASWGLVAEAEGSGGHDGYAGTSLLQRRLRWLGTRDLSPFLAVPTAIDWSLRHDGKAERTRCAELADRTARRGAGLFGLGAPVPASQGLRMALLPLPPCDAAAVKAALFDRFRVEVPATSHGGASFLRLSFHAYNGEADAEALLAALASLCLRG
jgi:isopenicillin-N epimerase